MASTIENKALKDQFDKLQKQNQEKLLRRKQKQDETTTAMRSESVTSRAFGVDDDLDLKLADPPPSGSMYSEELTQHLQNQIREMKDETGRLYKLLSERDLELRQLRKKREEDKASLTAGVTSDTAALKIVELSKKIREMTAELEKEKTKCKQTAKRCMDLVTELQQARIENSNSNQPGSTTSTERKTVPPSAKSLRSICEHTELDADGKPLSEKLKQAELKVSEYRNQCTTLSKELNMAQKVIEQEVGEGANYQQLLNSTSGWRGRAQQITALQKKINELKADLPSQQQSQRARPESGVDDLELEFMGGSGTVRSTAVNRHKDQLRKIEKEKKEQQEKVAAEMKALEADYESMKQKLEAAKARNKVLANENKANKGQLQTLLEKGRHDDELIEALFKQIAQLKNAMQESEQKQTELTTEKEQSRKQVVTKAQVDANLVEQLKVIVAEKERKVHELEDEIKQLRLAKAQMNGVNQLFEASGSRPGTGPSFYGNSQAVGAEVVEEGIEEEDNYGTLTPPPHLVQNSYRPPSNQRSRENTMDKLCSRPRSAPVDLNPQLVKKIEELKGELQENVSLCKVATVERDKLAQLIQVLQQRNEELVNSSTEAQQDVVQLRRKNVELEKRLAKANIAQPSASSRRTKSKVSLQSINFEEDPFMTDNNLEEIKTQLEIQRDENEALKAALQRTLKAKEEDLRLYNNMIDETKAIFLEGIRQHRQSKK